MSATDRSIDVCHCMALRKAARRITRLYDQALQGAAITANQFAILMELSRRGPAGIELWKLADVLELERSALARNLKVMARDAWVTLRVSASDLRQRQVAMTSAGGERLAQAKPAWQAAQERFSALLGADESATLHKLLAAANAANF